MTAPPKARGRPNPAAHIPATPSRPPSAAASPNQDDTVTATDSTCTSSRPAHATGAAARHPTQGLRLGLGSFALVPLAEARQRALANRRVARAGGDPRPAARRAPGIPTFDEAVATVLAIHVAAWKSGGRNANSWQATLRDYASPHLGRKAVDRVTTADVMAVLLPIWTRKHATAQKVRQRIGTVMKWAIAQGYRADNPPGDALTAALPNARSRAPPRALPHGEVSAAVATVRSSASWRGSS